MKIRPFVLFSLFFSHSLIVTAAEPTVNARVSATDMTLNSSITLVVEVSGVNGVNGSPSLSIPDFDTQPAGQTSSYQWINGQSSAMIAFNYVLTPTKVGNLQIPSINLNIGNKTYSTQPISITVRADASGGSTPANSKNTQTESRQVQVPAEGLKPMFMTATVDSDKVYVGQQIVLRVQFLKRPDVRFGSQARYSEPDMTGFLVEPLQQQEYNTTINGARYDVTEIPYALFPTSDGEFAIGSARVEVAVRAEPDPFDPNSFFQSFFGRTQVAQLNTRAVPIRVRALPANKPPNFSGAVGRFKVTAKVDTENPEVGKPFNLIVTVEGVGNIKTLKEPFMPEPRGFRRYETISSSKLSKDGKFIHGTKEFKILLIPQVSGQLTIPSVSFVSFNPAKGDYVTDVTAEIPLQVKPGTLNQADQDMAPVPSAPGQTAEGVRVMEKDIRFLKTGRVHPVLPPIFMRGAYLIFNFLPPLFALVAFLMKKQSTFRIEKASEYRARNALKFSKKELQRARKMLTSNDPAQFHGAIYKAVAGFLADKFSLSASGLVWEDVDNRLTEKNVDPMVKSALRDIFDQADMARFATSSFNDESRQEALTKAEKVITDLSEVL